MEMSIFQKIIEKFLDPIFLITIFILSPVVGWFYRRVFNWFSDVFSKRIKKVREWKEVRDRRFLAEALTIANDSTLFLTQYMRVAVNCIFLIGIFIALIVICSTYLLSHGEIGLNVQKFVTGFSIPFVALLFYTAYKTNYSQTLLNKALFIYCEKNVKPENILKYLNEYLSKKGNKQDETTVK
jgi:hypothetical protein